MIRSRMWDLPCVFLIVLGTGIGLVGLVRNDIEHTVSYALHKDEIAV